MSLATALLGSRRLIGIGALLSLLAIAAPVRAHGDEGGMHESAAAQAEAKKHAGAPRSFKKKPAVGTWATCPVSGETFQIDADTQFATWKGRTYAFCCPDCKGDFTATPEKFAKGPTSKA